MKVCLITGCTGYIGRHLIQQMSKDTDFEIRGIGRDVVDFSKEISESVYRDVGSPEALVHLAWEDSFIHSSPNHLQQLSNHYTFLQRMIDGGCHNITIAGTPHELGRHEGCISDETPQSYSPENLYGIAKNALRQAIFSYVEDKPVSLKWARIFYVTGDDLHNSSIFSKILQYESQRKRDFPFTHGTEQRDFIDIEDLSKMLHAVAVKEGVQEIINCCSGIPQPLANKVEQFIKDNKLSIRPVYGAFKNRSYDTKEVYGSTAKIRALLDINAKRIKNAVKG